MSSASADLGQAESERLHPALATELKEVGMAAQKVDEFTNLLVECNVCTRGALRLFAGECASLVDMMYDVDTKLGRLQANGFLAALQVCLSNPPAAPDLLLCPCSLSCQALMPRMPHIFHVVVGYRQSSGAEHARCAARTALEVSGQRRVVVDEQLRRAHHA